VVAAFKDWVSAAPNALLVLAPRHPERVASLRAEGVWSGLSAQYRSDREALRDDTQILVWDTLGELGAAMGLANIVFIGGSLVAHGGHNPLEASVWGIPVLTGPHTFNFEAVFRELVAVGGAIRVDDSAALSNALAILSQSPHEAARRGESGRKMVESHRGALEKQLALLSPWCV
jgi:3-deoxy-D-manno-octulosonic-acid transferase